MLISFSVENWKSFRDEAKFSMIATTDSNYEERLPFLKEYDAKVLPIASIYGGNASGKTNFFKAFEFVQYLILEGTRPDNPIPREFFLLNPECAYKPSSFLFEILINDIIYKFSFSVNNKEILEEKLTEVSPNNDVEETLYHRNNNQPNFHSKLVDKERLNFVFRGTRDNQLFLTNSVSQNIEDFKHIYNWFRNSLVLIRPDSKFIPFEHIFDKDQQLHEKMNQTLSSLDTGIAELGGESIPFSNLQLDSRFYNKDEIQNDIKEGETRRVIDISDNFFAITRKEKEVIAEKLVTYHKNSNGQNIKFEILQESDGSRRLIDLLPAFLDIASHGAKKIYFIDEIDRSLHPNLTKELIERYLLDCNPELRSQLLFTTHAALLLDEDLLRWDEMWLTERNFKGESRLYPVSDYYEDVSKDKNLLQSYLRGRMGGIPSFGGK
jgi:AAA15 family ATPase/GTPase